MKPDWLSRFGLCCTSELRDIREMQERLEVAICLRGKHRFILFVMDLKLLIARA